jgi:hypothetical protein
MSKGGRDARREVDGCKTGVARDGSRARNRTGFWVCALTMASTTIFFINSVFSCGERSLVLSKTFMAALVALPLRRTMPLNTVAKPPVPSFSGGSLMCMESGGRVSCATLPSCPLTATAGFPEGRDSSCALANLQAACPRRGGGGRRKRRMRGGGNA